MKILNLLFALTQVISFLNVVGCFLSFFLNFTSDLENNTFAFFLSYIKANHSNSLLGALYFVR